jgi:hypothetical protein
LSVGASSTLEALDINAIINSGDRADGLHPELKRFLIMALRALGSGPPTNTGKGDMTEG